MAARTGSESACKIPSTVMSSSAGWKSGRMESNIAALETWFNSSYIRNYGTKGQTPSHAHRDAASRLERTRRTGSINLFLKGDEHG
jgi:hypothetical protein